MYIVVVLHDTKNAEVDSQGGSRLPFYVQGLELKIEAGSA